MDALATSSQEFGSQEDIGVKTVSDDSQMRLYNR